MIWALLLLIVGLSNEVRSQPHLEALDAFQKKFYWMPDELGVRQISLPGSVDKKTDVVLHIYLKPQLAGGEIQAKGFFFAESTAIDDLVGSRIEQRGLSPWGHSGQPEEVLEWSYPVSFTDKETGQVYNPQIEKAVYEEGNKNGLNFRYFPVPFTVNFKSSVECIDVKVKDWLHMREVCISDLTDVPGIQVNPLSEWHQGEEAWKVWAVLTPWRGGNQGSFARVLVHYVNYHAQIKFTGTLVYCSPALLQELLADDEILAHVASGKLKLMLWDRFNRFQRLNVQKVPYYEVPDQIVINNHALLTFGFEDKAVLFFGDIDEFLVPRPPYKSVIDVIEAPSCIVGDSQKTKEEHAQSWGLLELQRRNFRSDLTPLEEPEMDGKDSEGLPYTFVEIPDLQAEEISFWEDASTDFLTCHPLCTYNMYQVSNGTFNWQPPKQLLRAKGGVHAFHVHYGIPAEGKTPDVFLDECAFVLHAVNMWSSRVRPSAFDHQDGGWRTMLPTTPAEEYQKKCLQKHPSGAGKPLHSDAQEYSESSSTYEIRENSQGSYFSGIFSLRKRHSTRQRKLHLGGPLQSTTASR